MVKGRGNSGKILLKKFYQNNKKKIDFITYLIQNKLFVL